MPIIPFIPFIVAGASAATSIAGGASNRGAQRRAAAAQAEAGYDASGYVWDNTDIANQGLSESGLNGRRRVEESAVNAQTGMTESQQAAAAGVNQATGEANAGMNTAVDKANGYLDPYLQTGQKSLGTLSDLLSPGGRYAQMMDEKFSFNPDQDPSYQFVLQQGLKAIQKSAAARGGLQGSGTLRSLNKFAAGQASKEYANQFDRFQLDRNNRGTLLNNMSTHLGKVAGMGLDAGTQMGRNNMAGAQYTGDNTVDAATYAGNTGLQAAQFNGNVGMNAAQWSGNQEYRTAFDMGRNRVNAATYQGNNRMGVGDAQGASIINGNESMWNGIQGGVNTLGNAVMGWSMRPRAPINTGATIPGWNSGNGNEIGWDGKPVGNGN